MSAMSVVFVHRCDVVIVIGGDESTGGGVADGGGGHVRHIHKWISLLMHTNFNCYHSQNISC